MDPVDDYRILRSQEMGDGTDYEVYQFDLPAHSLTRFQGLPSWIYEVATYPPHEVVAFLRSFWAPLKNPTAIGLKNYLLKQAPTCIFLSPVVDGNIEDATPELCFDTEWHMEVRLANLASPQEMNAALKEFRERDVQFLRELGCYFGEMRFGTPTEYLAQYWFRSWNSDGRFDAKWIGRTGYEEWDRALVIFSNSGGDTILLKKSGVVGFWRPSELRVLTLKIGLEEFLSGYTARALFPRDSHYVKSELFIESLD